MNGRSFGFAASVSAMIAQAALTVSERDASAARLCSVRRRRSPSTRSVVSTDVMKRPPGRPAVVGNRAIGKREICFFEIAVPIEHEQAILAAKRFAGRHDLLEHRREHRRPDFRPALRGGPSEGGRMLLRAQHRPRRVVVQLDVVGSPHDRHGESRREHEADGGAQRLRPAARVTERRLRPVERSHELAHLAAAGETRVERCRMSGHWRDDLL